MIAFCSDCDFQEGDYLSAARLATKHCKETGHTLNVEVGLHYDVKKDTSHKIGEIY
jgi:hypothetical protein